MTHADWLISGLEKIILPSKSHLARSRNPSCPLIKTSVKIAIKNMIKLLKLFMLCFIYSNKYILRYKCFGFYCLRLVHMCLRYLQIFAKNVRRTAERF